MDRRLKKQVIIAVIFFALLGSLGYGTFRIVVPPPPPATPNPTINVIPLRILSSKLLIIASGDYDFAAKVNNPNTDFGSGQVSYDLAFKDTTGTVVEHLPGIFFILPGQTKYVVNTPIHLSHSAISADMSIKSVTWQKLDAVAANGINLKIKQVSEFQLSTQPGSFGKVSGSILNNSDLDFNSVNAVTVLTDDSGMPIAVNNTEIRTFLARTTRGFEAIWYQPFMGSPSHAPEVEVQTNLFANNNFLRQYKGSTQQFQQQY